MSIKVTGSDHHHVHLSGAKLSGAAGEVDAQAITHEEAAQIAAALLAEVAKHDLGQAIAASGRIVDALAVAQSRAVMGWPPVQASEEGS